MYKIILIFLLSSLPSIVFGNIFTEIKIGDITLKYVSYNISSDVYNIKVGISEDAVSLSELALQHNGVSAINGVFFCPEDYRQCNGLNYTINERFVNGEDLSFYPDTGERGVFGWDENGVPFIHKTNHINPDIRENIYEGLGNFPILFQDGQNLLENYIDNGLYDSKMKASVPRHFICSNKENTHIYVGRSSPVSLEGLTPALYQLGCWDALNLDAGKSSHFNYNGREIVKGGRKIIDGIIIQRIGLDVKEIESSVRNIILQVENIYKKYPKEIALSRLELFLEYIPKIRADIYEQYSSNNYSTQGVYQGYTLEVTSLLDLKKVYTLNILERELKKLYTKINN